ncbi:DNA-directed DNA polymerase X [Ascosphaera apis ARSEF 7405]|uniref:DNA-directed DNA polymerase X n=1 Tax=Ascosphaera apis ARSEF 7405 TaxID=392613 RepID=A0A168BRG1_9EURO|nr:DNA-directed DNA polymerase X [Ascosphaera apis ARSEF 7405]
MSVDKSLLSERIQLPATPPIFVLPLNLTLDELHAIEESIVDCGATLTYDVKEAGLVVGKITQKKRAAFELRTRGQWTEEATEKELMQFDKTHETSDSPPSIADFNLSEKMVKVVKLAWFLDSLKAKKLLPLKQYVVYIGRRVDERATPTSIPSSPQPKTVSGILERAKADMAASSRSQGSPFGTPQAMRWRSRALHTKDSATKGSSHSRSTSAERNKAADKLTLMRQTTSEKEAAEDMPPAPDWVKNNIAYACQRSAYLHCPNEEFIEQLIKIRKIRELTLDEIGVRAYSTAIAAIAAYDHPLRSAKEVLRLPGCQNKVANLFTEWKRSPNGTLEAAEALDKDPELRTLALFNDIWGVGPRAARDFYHRRGWRDLDDVIEHGWSSLTRVQQIGVKYFDELLVPIPRAEVEAIEEVIIRNARKARPDADKDGHGIESVVVGGYRRGKEMSGDVDIILSHRDPNVTKNLAYDVVANLEEEGYITHTLVLNLTNSDRDQHPAPVKPSGEGAKFDTLDKALVVWQDPDFEGKLPVSSPEASEGDVTEEEGEAEVELGDLEDIGGRTLRQKRKRKAPKGEHQKRKTVKQNRVAASHAHNTNPHRRVDIIISPWRTVGASIVGWTGDKTFERDLRRFAKAEKNWKFDSTGVRDRATGDIIDLEDGGETWRERERMVLDGIGVKWRPPEERCSR